MEPDYMLKNDFGVMWVGASDATTIELPTTEPTESEGRISVQEMAEPVYGRAVLVDNHDLSRVIRAKAQEFLGLALASLLAAAKQVEDAHMRAELLDLYTCIEDWLAHEEE